MIIKKSFIILKVFFVILELQDNVVSHYDDTSISINFILQNNLKINFIPKISNIFTKKNTFVA